MMTSRALGIGALTVSAMVAVAGCGSSDGGSAATSPGHSASSSASTGTTSSGPAVPANWQEAAIPHVAQLQTPPGWKVTPGAKLARTLNPPKNKIGIPPGSVEFQAGALGGEGDVKSNREELAAEWKKRLAQDGNSKIERLPDETINGATLFHFRYESGTDWGDFYGTVTPDIGYQITIQWTVHKATSSRADEAGMIKQVMPTFKLL